MYSHKHTVGFAECGENGTLRLADAMSLMVNCCQYQEHEEKKLREFLSAKKIAMFLYAVQIDVERMPSVQEEIEITVGIYDIKSIFGYRRITIRDTAGRLLAIANAIGAFYDIEGGKAAKIDPAELNARFDEAEDMETLPRKIPLTGDGMPLPGYTVGKSDIDPNEHMQSSRYIALAEDRLPDGIRYDRVRVEFKQQSLSGEKLGCTLRRKSAHVHTVEITGMNSKTAAVVEFSLR